ILDRWSSAMFDAFLERDAKTIVRDHLARGGHLDAKIDAAVHVAADGGAKTLAVTVDPGPVVPTRLEFTGNAGLPTSRLDEAARAIGTLAAWLDPPAFARAIQAVYRDEGFLAAQVDMAPPEVRNGTSVVTVCVHEDSAFEIGKVTLEGGGALPE